MSPWNICSAPETLSRYRLLGSRNIGNSSQISSSKAYVTFTEIMYDDCSCVYQNSSMQNTSTIHVDVWNDCLQRSYATVQCDTVDRTTSSSPVSHASPSPQLLPRGPGNFEVDPKSVVWNEIPHGFTAVSKKGVRPGLSWKSYVIMLTATNVKFIVGLWCPRSAIVL